jgi:hypothetical protein
VHTSPPETAPPKRPMPVRPASIRYLGFECTREGRAYSLRVDNGDDPRLFTVTIPTAAFESRKARFHDEYRDSQLRRSPDRKTRTQRTWP